MRTLLEILSTTVGKDANHAELCAHCAAVIAKWKNNLTCIIKNYKGAETNLPLILYRRDIFAQKKHIWCAVMIILITAFDRMTKFFAQNIFS